MEDFKEQLEKYREMSKAFRKLSFRDKIIELQKNRDIFTLTFNDEFRWRIKVTDPFIQEELEDLCEEFEFRNTYISTDNIPVLFYIMGFDVKYHNGEKLEFDSIA